MNQMKRLHPVSLFLYFSMMMVLIMFTSYPQILLLSVLSGITFQGMLQKKFPYKTILFSAGLTVLSALLNPFLTHKGITILFYFNGKAITWEAMVYGAFMGMTLSAAFFWFQCFSFFLTREKLLFLFRKVPKMGMILTMSFRFIPMFLEKWKQIHDTQMVMGNVREDTYQEQIQGQLNTCSILMTWSLENGMDTADSMRARGYELSGKTTFSLFRFRKEDGILLAFMVIVAGMLIIGMTKGALSFTCYPSLTKINHSLISKLCTGLYGLTAFLPVLLEIKEVIQWKYYSLRM